MFWKKKKGVLHWFILLEVSLLKCVQEDVDASMSNRLNIDLRETVYKSYTAAISLFVEVKCETMLTTTQVREDVFSHFA